MRLKQIFQSVIAILLLLPTFGGVGGAISAQDAPGSPCTTRRVELGTSHHTLESGGIERGYFLYVPESYDGTQPVPLVISLHGFGGNPREQERDSGWDTIAYSENFIVVYPAATGSPLRWNAGQHEIAGIHVPERGLLAQFLSSYFETVPTDDVAFIHDLIMALEADNCIDSARIYVNGMSNGGGMTYRLACELSDQIAAAGMVSGAYSDFPGGCHPSRPIPVIAFHGKADTIVPYNGNLLIQFPPIERWVVDWADRDQCDAAAKITLQVSETVTSTRYPDCAEGAEVVFYSISDGGHDWPGSRSLLQATLGASSQDIDASETMWLFFKAHPMP